MTEKLLVFGDNMLLKREEIKTDSEFITPGGSDDRAPVFLVELCGSDAGVNPGDRIVLKPGTYDAVNINGKKYTYATAENVMGKFGGAE